MEEIKITKRTLIKEGMFNLKYYLIQGKIINESKTMQRKFKLVVNFDDIEICEELEKDTLLKQDRNNYLNDCIDGYLNLINNYNDCNNFFNACNDSIIKYNNTIKDREI